MLRVVTTLRGLPQAKLDVQENARARSRDDSASQAVRFVAKQGCTTRVYTVC